MLNIINLKNKYSEELDSEKNNLRIPKIIKQEAHFYSESSLLRDETPYTTEDSCKITKSQEGGQILILIREKYYRTVFHISFHMKEKKILQLSSRKFVEDNTFLLIAFLEKSLNSLSLSSKLSPYQMNFMDKLSKRDLVQQLI